jgi:spermidine synthase
VVSPRLFHALTNGLAYLPAEGWYSSLGRLLTVAFVTMLPATLALGMALPLVMEMASPREDESAGPLVGRLLAVNTVGAIAGPLVATFLMGPRLGLWWSLVVLGGLVIAAGSIAGLTRAETAIAGSLVAAALLLLDPAGQPPIRVRSAAGERLVSVREGTYGTTAVVTDDHERWITVNNSYVLGGTGAIDEERWQGHLPLLLHPSPRRVAFLGTGTGITAGAALLHSVERIVALEIVPEVAIAAREDFPEFNSRVMDDPRLRPVTIASSPECEMEGISPSGRPSGLDSKLPRRAENSWLGLPSHPAP